MIPAFRAIRTAIKDIQRLQDALSKVFNAIQTKQLLDGKLITGVTLTTAQATEVSHGLGKPIRGWIVVSKNADANIYVASASVTPNFTFLLTTTANVDVSLWVF